MNKYELIEILSSADEEEVFIKDAEGYLCDIQVGHEEEAFDGFVTAYPASISLKAVTNNVD